MLVMVKFRKRSAHSARFACTFSTTNSFTSNIMNSGNIMGIIRLKLGINRNYKGKIEFSLSLSSPLPCLLKAASSHQMGNF